MSGIHVEWLQVGENCRCVKPAGASPGTVNDSANAPDASTGALPSVLPHADTLMSRQPVQSRAEAVISLPRGPWAADSDGMVASAPGRGGDGSDGDRDGDDNREP